MTSGKLQMTFDPNTIEHLGVKMYSNMPNALAELIANAYDAMAHNVLIHLCDINGVKSVSVSDDGEGMNFSDVNDKFLRIGRKRRGEDGDKTPDGKRKLTGRKGLGKLAFFGLADDIEITTKKESEETNFTLSWEKLTASIGAYEPEFSKKKSADGEHGTRIILKKLKRQSGFDVPELAVSLSKLFNLFSSDFSVVIKLNNEKPVAVSPLLRYVNIEKEVTWRIPGDLDFQSAYVHETAITGELYASTKPLKPGLRGITLFAHGRLVNIPEFFGASESSHAYSYLTGFLNVDFVDEFDFDPIATDRQTLNWEYPQTAALLAYLKRLMLEAEKAWRLERARNKKKAVARESGIDIDEWYNKLPDIFRVRITKILKTIEDNSEFPDLDQANVVSNLHSIIPEYPYYHWRNLHELVKRASQETYERKDYYSAVQEAIKAFENSIRTKTKLTEDGQSLMPLAFGKDGKLNTIGHYKRPNKSEFTEDSKQNINEGQKFLSMGVVRGVRNPLAHEEKRDLRDSGLFSEKDCLDILSLLSHLFKRLDDSTIRSP